MKGLDPAALDCLAALVDEGGFAAAARRLAITQSAVSQRLRALESHLGQPLVVRTRPLRLTEPGRLLLRYARQMQALREDASRELGRLARLQGERVPIAVNADSLATWVLPALDTLVHEGITLELLVDDQDFTHAWLREGAVLGCVSTVRRALRGCRVAPLGTMDYAAVASPDFVARHLGGDAQAGLTPRRFPLLPFLVFNRKDDMQRQWASRAFGVREPRLREVFVPSSEASLRAAMMGWGIAVAPTLQARPWVEEGDLTWLRPETRMPVELFWHQWRLVGSLGDSRVAGTRPPATLDRIGQALAEGARRALGTAGTPADAARGL